MLCAPIEKEEPKHEKWENPTTWHLSWDKPSLLEYIGNDMYCDISFPVVKSQSKVSNFNWKWKTWKGRSGCPSTYTFHCPSRQICLNGRWKVTWHCWIFVLSQTSRHAPIVENFHKIPIQHVDNNAITHRFVCCCSSYQASSWATITPSPLRLLPFCL